MPGSNHRPNRGPRFRVGSLMAIGEIMLVLWITSLLAGMTTQVQLDETPIAPPRPTPADGSEFDHQLVVGPGAALSLDGKMVALDQAVETLVGDEGSRIELRADSRADLAFFFQCRYRLRTAGVGYTERPPPANNTEKPKGTAGR